MKKLAIAFVLGLVTPVLIGAASQYVYEHQVSIAISTSDAAVGANWFINKGAWDGTVAEIDKCEISRFSHPDLYGPPDPETGERELMTPAGDRFMATCTGRKTVPADSMPEGVRVLEVIN